MAERAEPVKKRKRTAGSVKRKTFQVARVIKSSLTAGISAISSSLVRITQKLNENKLALFNLVISLHIASRLTALEQKIDAMGEAFQQVTIILMLNLMQMSAQVEGLLNSVLSLFGGSPS